CRRLPAARRTEQREEFPVLDLQREIVDGEHGVVALRDTVKLDCRCARRGGKRLAPSLRLNRRVKLALTHIRIRRTQKEADTYHLERRRSTLARSNCRNAQRRSRRDEAGAVPHRSVPHLLEDSRRIVEGKRPGHDPRTPELVERDDRLQMRAWAGARAYDRQALEDQVSRRCTDRPVPGGRDGYSA